MNKKLRQQIEQAVISGIRRNGERIFSTSQATERGFCPVDKGILKNSGEWNYVPNGVEIVYRASYSNAVHSGISEDIPITGTQEVQIKAHKRKDGKMVKAHTKTYVNKRVVRIRPKLSEFEWGKRFFRVIDKIKARPGNPFLLRAVKEEIPHLKDDIAYELNKLRNMEAKV